MLASHRPRVEAILGATGAFSEEEVDVALELFDDAFGAAPSGDYEFRGVYRGEELAGYACFGAAPGTVGTYDLYWIATDPALHGAGYGRALLSGVERALTERGARLVVAETSSRDSYAATRGFYARCGYEAAATVADFYAPGDGRVLYTKRVDAGARGTTHGSMYDDTHGTSDGTTSTLPTGASDGRGAAAR